MTATRLTPAQADALRLVGDGLVVRSMGKWYHRGHWQALRPQPYERLLRLELISFGKRDGFDVSVVLADATESEE